MRMLNALVAALAMWAALSGGRAGAAVDSCPLSAPIGSWKAATGGTGVCEQGDKLWKLGTTNLPDTTLVLFTPINESTHVMQFVGFDATDAATSWFVNYSVQVADPTTSFISAMHVGSDNPGGGSAVTKVVTGDPGGPFTLTVLNGVEGPDSEKHGLKGMTLNVSETLSVNAGASLMSVSNTYFDELIVATAVPTMSDWALIASTIALLAIGGVHLSSPVSRRAMMVSWRTIRDAPSCSSAWATSPLS